ncbi:hypothetical protein [Streptomyces sp. NPDC102264]|uniref:hypothetical protein n=1 Tax=Streptomyces sp. NPDC102264 TaxID=3366149 RepID=UPI00381D28E0
MDRIGAPYGAIISTNPTPCDKCHGAAGHVETTVKHGVRQDTWIRCGACNGTGSK